MRKYTQYILILIILTGLFGLVINVNAQESYHLLAPLPGVDADFDAAAEGSGALAPYLNTMIKIFIGLCAVLAVIMIVIGGIEYMTSELAHTKEHGKERITGAIIGLLIALGAYALLYTINPDLLGVDLSNLTMATITVEEIDIPQTPVNGKYRNGIAVGTPLTGGTTSLPPSVTLNAAECASVGQQNCTSTRGLNMSKVQAIQQGCKCSLVITGGTEWWLHGGKTGSTSHQSGNATIDLRRTPQLDAYLSGGKPLVAMRRYQSPAGSVLFEGNHWHIGP